MPPRDAPATDLDELKSLRASYARDLQSVLADQAAIQEALDGLLTAAPNSVPLGDRDRRTVQAGTEARATSEEFVSAIELFLMIIDRQIALRQAISRTAGNVAESHVRVATAERQMRVSQSMVLQSRELIEQARSIRADLSAITNSYGLSPSAERNGLSRS